MVTPENACGHIELSVTTNEKKEKNYLIATFSTQNAVLSMYFSLLRRTPLPPSSIPRAFLMIVIGCMGSSKSHN
jgi:hypothetical protein